MAVIYNVAIFLQMYLNPLNERTKQLKAEYDIVLKKNAVLDSKISAIDRAKKENNELIEKIDTLSNMRPESIYFTKIDTLNNANSNVLTINGFSTNIKDINIFSEKLSQEKNFKNVKLEKITSNNNQHNNEIKNFVIKITETGR